MKEQGEHKGPIMLVNTFTPRPGKLDEFVEAQSAEARRLIETGRVHGLRGSRLLKSLDANRAIGIAAFESLDAHKQWIVTNDFSDHFKRIEQLIERAEARFYEMVFQAGDI